MDEIKKIFQEFIEKNYVLEEANDINHSITSAQLEYIREKTSVEAFLDFLVSQYNCLLHGSSEFIAGNELKTNGENKLYATNTGSIALLKAIITNKGLSKSPGLQYPFIISDITPLEVRIRGITPHTVKESGIVYVIKNRDGFVNDPTGSWQYVKRGDANFTTRLEVLRKDFTYPVFDVDHGVRMPEK